MARNCGILANAYQIVYRVQLVVVVTERRGEANEVVANEAAEYRTAELSWRPKGHALVPYTSRFALEFHKQ